MAKPHPRYLVLSNDLPGDKTFRFFSESFVVRLMENINGCVIDTIDKNRKTIYNCHGKCDECKSKQRWEDKSRLLKGAD